MLRAGPIRLACAASRVAEERAGLSRACCSSLAGAVGAAEDEQQQQQPQQQQQQQEPPPPPKPRLSTTTTTRPRRRLHTSAFAPAASAAATPSSSSASSSRAREAQRQRERLDVRLEAQVMFEAAWRRFEARHPAFLRRARVPRECVFLQGAPAAGKGTHTPAICDSRALARVISMSGLLETSPLAREAIDRGEMIDDALVGDALLEALLAPPTPEQIAALAAPVAAACPPPPPLSVAGAGGSARSSSSSSSPPLTTTTTTTTPAPGVLIDGFPRTAMQVDFLKLLHERLLSLHDAAAEQQHQQQQQQASSDGGGHGSNGSNQMLEEAAARFPRVAFRVVALFVDEATSLARQQGRAKRTAQLNARVLDAASLAPLPPAPPHPAAAAAAGAAALLPAGAMSLPSAADDDDEHHHPHASHPSTPAAEDLLDGPRATDADEQRAKTRYAVFRRHYPSLLRLRAFLPFHLVDASGDEDDVRDAILSELRYQSSVELSAAAYGVVRTLPLASDLQAAARQALVSRLDGYASQRPRLLHEVAALLRREAVPILRRAGLVGRAEWLTRASVFEAAAAGGADAAATATTTTGAVSSTDDASSTTTPSPSEEAVDMVVDLLSDRGFNASHTREEQLVPTRFDAKTGEVLSVEPRLVAHRFSITFEAPGVRQLRAMETAARVAETSAAAMGGVGALSAGGFAAAVVARKPSPAALGAAVERVHQKLAERERARREAHARALREVEERQKQQSQQSQEQQDAAAVAG